MHILFLILVMISSSAMARITDADIESSVAMGDEMEDRVTGDLNGDGVNDVAYVVGSIDNRNLYVLMGKQDGEYTLVGTQILDKPPIDKATLSITNGVLNLIEHTGQTVAIAATYRYRLDTKKERMRLIGLDAKLYYRDFSKEGFELSWNMLTYKMVTHVLKPDGASYEKAFEQKYEWLSNPVYMEETIDPELLMIELRKK